MALGRAARVDWQRNSNAYLTHCSGRPVSAIGPLNAAAFFDDGATGGKVRIYKVGKYWAELRKLLPVDVPGLASGEKHPRPSWTNRPQRNNFVELFHGRIIP